jgi:hypothetical protein
LSADRLAKAGDSMKNYHSCLYLDSRIEITSKNTCWGLWTFGLHPENDLLMSRLRDGHGSFDKLRTGSDCRYIMSLQVEGVWDKLLDHDRQSP